MIIIRKIWAIITLPILVLTLLTTPDATSTESAELISEDVFVLDKALLAGQGITTDGEYLYTSGSITAFNFTALAKFSFDDVEIRQTAINPLPDKCTQRGNNHIGGISYYNGRIYAPVEGGDICYACIVVYDAETLEPTGEVYDLPNENYDDGVPWCAVDGETGYLYCTDHSKQPTKLLVYDTANKMDFVKEIPLSFSVPSIQGAEFYNGILYAATNDETKAIYKINPVNGEVEKHLDRNLLGGEGEGMTFIEKDGETVLIAMDMGTIFVNAFIREYPV